MRASILPVFLMVALTGVTGCGSLPAAWAGPSNPSVMAAGTTPEVLAELRSAVVPLKTVLPGSDTRDLQGLKRVLAHADVVGLGESSHGTREIFQVKHRVLEYLVKELGFKVFAMEIPWSVGLGLDRFVKTGQGDLAQIAESLGVRDAYPYGTEEVMDLIRWARDYNRTVDPQRQITFAGMDMQGFGTEAKVVVDYVGRLGSAESDQIRQLYRPVFQVLNPGNYYEASSEKKAAVRQNLSRVLRFLDEHRNALVTVSSEAEFLAAFRSAVTLQQAEASWSLEDWDQLSAKRDEAMADNVRFLNETFRPGQKVVVWAHDSHIDARNGHMGSFLRQRYHDRYYSFAVSFYQGEVLARPSNQGGKPAVIPLQPAREGSLDAAFHQVGTPMFWLDFRSVAARSPLASWLNTATLRQTIGATYPVDNPEWLAKYLYEPTVPGREFDGHIFLDRGTASRLMN